VFPRKYAKTETFGVSLMDSGVGLFIFMSGLTSKYARAQVLAKSGQDKYLVNFFSWNVSGDSIQKILVLSLGVGRMLALRLIGYHTHVSEYGKEWNFFVSLFFIWSISDMCRLFLTQSAIFCIFLVILICYQVLLVDYGLTEFIFQSERYSFFTDNREGIFSIFGGLNVYIVAEMVSSSIFFSKNVSRNVTMTSQSQSDLSHISSAEVHSESCTISKSERINLIFRLVLATLSAFSVWMLSEYYQETSRRLFNVAFSSYILFLGFFCLLFLVLLEHVFADWINMRLKIFEMFNNNQLLTFLVANVITGCVNVMFETIYIEGFQAFLILSLYLLSVHLSSALIDSVCRHKHNPKS
jgi:phosphatidylinositol glycan class W